MEADHAKDGGTNLNLTSMSFPNCPSRFSQITPVPPPPQIFARFLEGLSHILISQLLRLHHRHLSLHRTQE
ncbi:hypothetical protein BT93_B2485 [Corymbia citriodora subsp. variegata]|nr:hypothetical protein BT93_B2485 [Corymbia citriodora subsp. variegata]